MVETNVTIGENTKEEIDKIKESPAFLEAQEKISRKRRTYLISGFITSLIAFILVFVLLGTLSNWTSESFTFVTFFIAFAIALLIGSGFFTYYRRRVVKPIASNFIPVVTQIVMGPDTEWANDGYSRTFLESLSSFPVNSLQESDRISGSYKGVPYIVSDVQSFHMETHSNGKTTTTSKVIDFNGTIFVFRFNKPSDAVISISQGISKGVFHKTIVATSIKGSFEPIETESIDFNNKFVTYVNDHEKALYVLTPQNILSILDASNIVKGRISFIIDRYAIAIICSGKTTSLADSIKGKLTERDLYDIANKLLPIKAFIDILKLDNTYWLDIDKMKKFTPEFLVTSLCYSASFESYSDSYFSYLLDL